MTEAMEQWVRIAVQKSFAAGVAALDRVGITDEHPQREEMLRMLADIVEETILEAVATRH